MKSLVILLFVLLNFVNANGQDLAKILADTKYKSIIKEGFNHYKNKEYRRAGFTYEQAFKLKKPEKVDLYNAACAWALAGEKKKAFKILASLAKNGYSNYKHITSDPDFTSIHSDKKWDNIIDQVKENQASKDAKYGTLIKSLNTILKEDQHFRLMIDSVYKKFGWQSTEFRNLNKKIHEIDSVNLKKVSGILDTYGWLGPEEVGGEGSTAIFLVIQHADLTTQKKYLPIMREAVRKGKALSQNLALLEDRVLLKEGKKQIYGSQVTTDPKTQKPTFSPIEDEPNVNKRRASVGLQPIEEYAKLMGVDYKPTVPINN
jgi:hypothetical protein